MLVAGCLLLLGAARVAAAWFRYRGTRLITCPENLQPAGVRVDARHAAVSGLASSPDLRLRLESCSRWPEKAGCGQDCLRQIQASPEDCLIRNIWIRWYEGKSCALCGKPFGEIHAAEFKPGLLTVEGLTLDWSEIAPERLQAVQSTAKPVCLSCHLATSFARQHPEMVTDRARPA